MTLASFQNRKHGNVPLHVRLLSLTNRAVIRDGREHQLAIGIGKSLYDCCPGVLRLYLHEAVIIRFFHAFDDINELGLVDGKFSVKALVTVTLRCDWNIICG